MVQKRPMQASARKAPTSGVAAEVPPKLVSVVAALASGMWSCVVRYVSMLVENPTTASFSATSLAARRRRAYVQKQNRTTIREERARDRHKFYYQSMLLDQGTRSPKMKGIVLRPPFFLPVVFLASSSMAMAASPPPSSQLVVVVVEGRGALDRASAARPQAAAATALAIVSTPLIYTMT